MSTVRLGYELETGKALKSLSGICPLRVNPRPAGKITTLEGLVSRCGLRRGLRHQTRVNRLNNVVLIYTALMDVPGIVQIHDGEFWQFNAVRTAGSGTQVRATTLDNLRNEQQLDHIDFPKINIEGAEIRALQGMKDTIAKVRNICVCCHDFRADRGHGEEYRTREFVTEFLTKSGFSVSRRTMDPRDFVRDHLFGIRSEV